MKLKRPHEVSHLTGTSHDYEEEAQYESPTRSKLWNQDSAAAYHL
jgi:hypothetical protein